MKKWMIISLVLVILMGGVIAVIGFKRIKKLAFDEPKTITIMKNVGAEECGSDLTQYEVLVITDQKEIKNIVKQLNRIRYRETNTISEFCSNDYVIQFDGKTVLQVTKSKNKYYLGTSKRVLNPRFGFLDELEFIEKSKE